jgi:glycosyltransferase involved in cell wall biosynthesis
MPKISKVFDVSNSSARPPSRGLGRPVENSIVSYLKKYQNQIGLLFVPSIEECDVVFTNDVFPKSVLKYKGSKLFVKRMDGIFLQESLFKRNEKYNEAAVLADQVIFISKFSRQSYFSNFGRLPNAFVINNTADPEVFYPPNNPIKNWRGIFTAIATDWNREEKRFNSIHSFFRAHPELYLNLVGAVPKKKGALTNNIQCFGYVSETKSAEILRCSDALINLSYQDPCPKIVMQALFCGCPVLYSTSGGVPEIVTAGLGVGIYDGDPDDADIYNFIPIPSRFDIEEGYNRLVGQFPSCKEAVLSLDRKTMFFDTMPL